MTLRAHFDGKSLIPEEPIDLPANVSVEIEINQTSRRSSKPKRVKRGNEFPLARNDGVVMTSEEVATALYD